MSQTVNQEIVVEQVDLRECPFCGGEANTEVKHSKITGVRDQHFPSCLNADCPAFIVDPYMTWATKAEAIKAWNTRAAQSSHTDDIRREALEEAAKVAEALVGPDYDANDKLRNIGYRRAAAAIRARATNV